MTTLNKACWDDKCQVRDTCRLWTERSTPDPARSKRHAMTWRAHWLCFDGPCHHHQGLEQGEHDGPAV